MTAGVLSRAKNAALTMAVAASSIAVALALAEVLLRLVDFEYGIEMKIVTVGEEWRDFHMFEDDMFESDPLLLWRPKRSGEFYVKFNRDGYRGPEVATTKHDDELRVLAIGDSNTLGPKEYSWPGFLQERLEALCRDRRGTVVNAGVYGYSSYQGVRRFQESLRYAPDVVLVAFGWNDAVETTNLPDKFYGERSARFLSIKRFLARNSKLYQLTRSTSDRLRETLDGGLAEAGDLRPRVSQPDYRLNLSEIVTASLERGILPVLLTRPHVVDMDAEYTPAMRWRRELGDYNQIVRDVAREFEIPLVDAYAMFAADPDHFIDDNHLVESSARRLAGQVFTVTTRHVAGCHTSEP